MARAMIDLQSHSTVSDGQLEPADVARGRGRGGRDGDVADRPRRRRRRPRGGRGRCRGRHRDAFRPSRCPASTSTPRISTCSATGSTSTRSPPACDRAQQERVEPRQGDHRPASTRTGSRSRFEDAVAKAGAADSIGRPHIARAAGAGPDLGPFFEEYLVPGAKAFVAAALADRRGGRRADPRGGRQWPSSRTPTGTSRSPMQVRDLVESLVRDVGLEGIETFYPPHTKAADAALPRAVRGVRPRPDRRRRTSTARRTRRSRASAPTTPTGWASRRFPRGPKRTRAPAGARVTCSIRSGASWSLPARPTGSGRGPRGSRGSAAPTPRATAGRSRSGARGSPGARTDPRRR